MKSENITLYFRNAGSDKVYQAVLKEENGGYVVEFAFGRRGSTLQSGTKTQSPIEYEKAKKIYDKLIAEKTSKGYSPGEEGTLYIGTSKEERISGVQCQLLNPITEEELSNYVKDPIWCFQEKFDGKRMLVRRSSEGKIEGINRKGLVVGIPSSIEQATSLLEEIFVLDGEAIGDKLYVFDLLHYESNDDKIGDVRSLQYSERLKLMMKIKSKLTNNFIEIITTVTTEAEKKEFINQMKREGKEGIVIKKLDALYEAGRPSSGGNQLKYKFTETLSAIVLKLNDKRSVSVGLINQEGKTVDAGNVTILPNFPIPKVGDIIEVRYLYAHPQSGKLYQPIYLGVRDDIEQSACLTSQLKYKAVIDEEEN